MYELIENKDGFDLRLQKNPEIVIYRTYIQGVNKKSIVYSCQFPKVKGNDPRVIDVVKNNQALQRAYEYIIAVCARENYKFTDKTSQSRKKEGKLEHRVATASSLPEGDHGPFGPHPCLKKGPEPPNPYKKY